MVDATASAAAADATWHSSSNSSSSQRRQLVRHRVTAGEIGVAVDRRPQVRQAHAARAAVFARAVRDHFAADRRATRRCGRSRSRVAQAAGVAVVEDHRRAAEVLAVDHAAQVAAVAHRHEAAARPPPDFAGRRALRWLAGPRPSSRCACASSGASQSAVVCRFWAGMSTGPRPMFSRVANLIFLNATVCQATSTSP